MSSSLSDFQNRLRLRRTYQLESPSTKSSTRRDASAESYSSSAAVTSTTSWLSSESTHRSSSEPGPVCEAAAGLKPSMFAYVTKNEYTFHSGIRKRRRTSSVVPGPKLRLDAGLQRAYSHRMASTPISSAASSNQMAFPLLLCISAPFSSRINA